MGVFHAGNRWYIDVWDNYNKKRIRRVIKIDGIPPDKITRQDALKAESIAKAKVAQGNFDIPLAKEQISFENLMTRYLEWADSNHRAPEFDHYKANILLKFFKGKTINKISLWQIEQYKKLRKGLNRKPETINKELGILRRMFNLAVEWKILKQSPIAGMKLIPVPKRPFRVLKEWEFEKLYISAPDYLKPILLTAYLTGMRRGEIRNLLWSNVDFENNIIRVVETKNNEYRIIPMSSMLSKTLKQLKDNSQTEYVFEHDGKHYSSNSAWNKGWNKAIKGSGIDKCTFHDLRHTFITNLIVNHKEDFATVMSLSGHKDIKMLERYTHTHEDSKKTAVEKLEKTLKIESFANSSASKGIIDNVVNISESFASG